MGGGVDGGVGARRTDGVVVMAELRQLAALLLAHHRRDVIVGVGAVDAREHSEGALLGPLLLHEADALGAAADALARVEHLVRVTVRARVRVRVRVRVKVGVKVRIRVRARARVGLRVQGGVRVRIRAEHRQDDCVLVLDLAAHDLLADLGNVLGVVGPARADDAWQVDEGQVGEG